ncbi:type II toxin-antitoxin system mRNA interferase toxin, RelE/StbE family [Massilia eurypsychrophila]|uniref:Type II toxin-antitoxin system mRNA interferase toxin, RelE/StbE family n=1 Tax=Massilia eurypsychrophila TaxID=1485217 RepID=A0A2G8TG79_9BURK|nr:type II toxin-antitoxin system RelE/ParE family toxin [Massilia eurypsychrophila]PIL45061.1 type II toxin-antitoxin system mRNA interferase toxin, RelE/StbE family [Massilia eurypsychrophila]
MLPILWRPEAQSDLAAIFAYIARRNPQAATDLYSQIERLVSQLPQHPYLYRPGRVPSTRELIAHPNYIVVYRVAAAAIEIVSALHSRQKYP